MGLFFGVCGFVLIVEVVAFYLNLDDLRDFDLMGFLCDTDASIVFVEELEFVDSKVAS